MQLIIKVEMRFINKCDSFKKPQMMLNNVYYQSSKKINILFFVGYYHLGTCFMPIVKMNLLCKFLRDAI